MIRPGRFGCLDVHLFDDERFAKLSANAQSLFIAMTLYAAAESTDGRVPAVMVPRLLLAAHSRPKHLDELLDAGILERLGLVEGSPIADDYYLPAFLKWNMSKDDLDAEREANRQRQAAYRDRKQAHRGLRAVSQ